MKCPKCKIGELSLYKETEKVYRFKITKDNKIYKKPLTTSEYDSDKDYLECDNDECQQWFNYELNEEGKIIRDLLYER